MNLPSTNEKILKLAEKGGATQAEAFAILAKTSSVYIDDDIAKLGTAQTELGFGLKFIIDKKIGYTSSTLTFESIDEFVSRAASMARVSDPNPKFESLPSPKKVSGNPERFYDKTTAQIDSEYLTEKAMLIVDNASAGNVTVPNGTLRASSVDFNVMNSLGVDAGSKSTMVYGFFTAKSEASGSVGEGVKRCWSRNISDIEFDKIGEKLNEQALNVLQAKAFTEKWENVVAVIAPSESAQLLETLIGSATSGENVNRKSSPWTDKVGDVVAHESLTVVDNGLSEKGLLSALVDDEGLPMKKTPLIEKGVLQSYLNDSYNAAQLDLESTSNGMRRGAREIHGSFVRPVSCRTTTLEFTSSSKSMEDIITEIDKGVFVEHFAWPLVEPTTGSFSNEIRNAQLIENGELTRQIKHALLVGNLYESLKGDLRIANNLELQGISDIGSNGSSIIPTIAFPGTELVGQ
ncbi:MAG: TldD/PmbA family protein [Candidatus Thorarchaeota archaeon]|jgi:PmbA protein